MSSPSNFSEASGLPVTCHRFVPNAICRITLGRVPLLRHVKANGNQVVYGYNKDVFPSTITTLNKEQSQLNKLTLRRQKMGNQVRMDVLSPSGKLASYDFEKVKFKKRKKWVLKNVERSEAPSEKYHYDDIYGRLSKKEKPKDRILKIDYYGKGDNEMWPGKIVKVRSIRAGRTMRLSAPVGVDETLIPTHYFFYYLNSTPETIEDEPEILGGYTKVYDAYKHLTSYHFGYDQRLSQIDRYTGTSDHSLYTREQFFWGP